MGYSIEEVAELVKLPEAEVRRCLREGVLTTPWQAGAPVRLSFQDVVLLRSVAVLTSARIPPHRVRSALKSLRERLPQELPLSSLQISAGGAQVVVREGGRSWDAESQQLLLALDEEAPQPSPKTPATLVSLERGGAETWYERGCALDGTDPVRAIAAYREALSRDPTHVDARINLGRLLHVSGDVAGACVQFRQAADLRPQDATIVFNLAVALEDQGQIEGSIAAYARALFLAPGFADAHFNLARLYEKRGDRLAALRHLSAYRKAQLS